MTACAQPGCGGSVVDGFCDECGLAPAVSVAHTSAGVSSPTTGSQGSGRLSRRGTSKSSSRTSRTSRRTSRGRLGAGLVKMPEVPYRDPSTAIMTDPKVAEKERFCSNCGNAVGRGKDGVPGRTEGFCRQCGSAYSFSPKLAAGDLVSGQYEVLGCLAHGGLGWIYLARDRNVSDRWVVLKGLLDSGDADAMAAAAAERQFLATVEHPNIVKIYNFVQHPDPKSGELVGYIVMEYVGGSSLKDLRTGPMPVPQALAYMLEILPALGYLHAQGVLYCDFKPDNVIQSEEQLKLIDLGAVRRMDDEESAGYKTDGYAAPELETEGASIESDLFTIGRTLAVLTFNFDYRHQFLFTLPDPADIPLLAEYPSFYRLLGRATAEDPNERFASAVEMAEQVTGVLREVVATQEGAPRPGVSTVFSAERAVFGAEIGHWPALLNPKAVASSLPVPLVDITDPAAGFLATLAVPDARRLVAALEAAPVSSLEVTLALVRANIEAGNLAGARVRLAELESTDDADWRITWYAGLEAMAGGEARTARTHFDTAYRLLPGEAASKLALAACEEGVGNAAKAARIYELVWSTDHSYTSAAFGLARTRLACGDAAAAVAALDTVPASSSHYVAAQLAAVAARVSGIGPATQDLVEAGSRLAALELDAERRALVAISVLNAARTLVETGTIAGNGSTVLGCTFDQRSVRHGLEQQYRTLARLANDRTSRIELVNSANAVRPLTWI